MPIFIDENALTMPNARLKFCFENYHPLYIQSMLSKNNKPRRKYIEETNIEGFGKMTLFNGKDKLCIHCIVAGQCTE